MKLVKTTVAKKIRVKLNTSKSSKNDKHALIIHDIPFGRILHTGQTDYIRRVARQKYNINVDF